MANLFLKENRVDLRFNVGAMARLRNVAEQVKCQLSARPKAVVQIKEIAYGDGGQPLHLNFSLGVDQLREMAQPLIQRSFLICDEAMKLADLTATQIDDVVLVGGSTRMPLVREGVAGYFGRPPRTDINPDEVVAVGAAIQAAALARSPSTTTSGGGGVDSVLLDVTPPGARHCRSERLRGNHHRSQRPDPG